MQKSINGATFRKSDGKRLKVIANPQDPQFRHFLNNDLIFEKKEDILEEYKDNIDLCIDHHGLRSSSYSDFRLSVPRMESQ